MTITIDPTWETFTINFGKHKGSSIATVWQDAPGYVEWLAEKSFIEDVKVAAQHVMNGKPIPQPKAPEPVDNVLGDFEITFGKHKNETMGEIWLNDPSYIIWLARESYMDDVRKRAQAIIDNDPAHIEHLKEKVVNKKELVRLSTAISSDSNFEMPPEFGHGKTLYPYQLVAAEFLERAGGCAMISDTVGLGKTIEALTYLQNHPEERPAVIVCPKSVRLNWYNECYSWLSTDDFVEVIGNKNDWMGDIIIINYDIVNKHLDKLNEINPQVLILDECHRVKSYKAKRTIAITELAERIPHKILLSATNIMNRPSEFWTQLQIISPDKYNKKTFFSWHIKHCNAHKNQYGWDFSGHSNLEELAEDLKSIMIRREEEDVFDDLPTMIRSHIPVSITNRHIYNKARDDYISFVQEERGKLAADKASRAEHLTRLTGLKKIVADGKRQAVTEWIKDRLVAEDKIVIFAHHKTVITALMKDFSKIAVKIDGSTSAEERELAVKRFEDDKDIKIFVGQTQAAGEGINLGAAQTVAFIEFEWTPAAHEQAEGRLKGLRQAGRGRKHTYAYYFVAERTIDEEIITMLENKRQVVNGVVGVVDQKLDFNFLVGLVK